MSETAEANQQILASHELRGAGTIFGVDSFGRNLEGRYTDFQGTYGDESNEFLDLVQRAGFSELLDMPFSPPDASDCPYASDSAFAINWKRISLIELTKDDQADLDMESIGLYQEMVNADLERTELEVYKKELLTAAYENFMQSGSIERRQAYAEWLAQEDHWVEQYAAYTILRDLPENAEKGWQEWERGKEYSEQLVQGIKDEFADQFGVITYTQWIASNQALAFRKAAEKRGIKIRGDVPFYVNGADVWGNRALFDLNEDGYARHVSGAAADHFSDTGQIWGHPMYAHTTNLEALEPILNWWEKRLQRVHTLTGGDTRLDYFVGMAHPWAVPADAASGAEGQRIQGFGTEFLGRLVLNSEIMQDNHMSVYAEAVGDVTETVKDLMAKHSIPPMLVYTFLQWGSDISTKQDLPENHTPNSTAFTSTHDTVTIMDYATRLYENAVHGNPAYENPQTARQQRKHQPRNDRTPNPHPWTHLVHTLTGAYPHDYLVHDRNNITNMREITPYRAARYAVKHVLDSAANTAVVPVWDVLYDRARFNTPGTYNGQPGFTGQNWTRRYDAGAFKERTREIRAMIEASGRTERQLAHLALAA